MSAPTAPPDASVWGHEPGAVTAVAHNVSTRYLAYVIDAVGGLVMLPFNLSHLGMAAHGLWMSTSFTVYFHMLELGYGGALVRFVAPYHAQRDDGRAINEVLSTFSLVYEGIGAVAYVFVIIVALGIFSLMSKLTPDTGSERRDIAAHHRRQRSRPGLLFGWSPAGSLSASSAIAFNNLTSIADEPRDNRHPTSPSLLSGYGILALVAGNDGC